MRVTKEEAVEMYARFWVARHKQAASKLAREVGTSLACNGDHEGRKIWNQVADTIDRRPWDRSNLPPLEGVTSPS